ncbi:hypothetical protein Tco_0892424 [Tanacetum coccineum]|uniref:Uncharacterized protein n=1 Tax=Tanacetum coccineum TaxID=301880 RepID=A0ABQ5C8L9_9ASTR
MKTMVEQPHVKDEIWKLQPGYRVINWKLFDSCGVHCLTLQSGTIYMLIEKRYPLTPPTITDMLNKKLQVDYFSEMAYQLLKLLKKQGRIVGIKSFLLLFTVSAVLIEVNTAQSKLLLLKNFNENILSSRSKDMEFEVSSARDTNLLRICWSRVDLLPLSFEVQSNAQGSLSF